MERLVPHYSWFFFFFLPPPPALVVPGFLARCTFSRVHDSSLSHSKPSRYGLSSSSSAYDRMQQSDAAGDNVRVMGE